MHIRQIVLPGLVLMMGSYVFAQQSQAIPRTPDGHPDLTGTYDANTLTPIERPAKYNGRQAMTDQEAEALIHAQQARAERAEKPSDPNRKAPNAGSIEATTSGSGAYDDYWKSFGNSVVTIGGEKRSSIVIDPANGRIPSMTQEGNTRDDSFGGLAGRTDVLERRGDLPSAFDDPESRVNSERCIMAWGWSSGTPILPNYQYNNLKQIVQTPNQVVIVTEMIHDARVVRIGGQHPPSNVRSWLGDSIGHWDGDTLVIETTNFTDKTRFRGSSENLKVTERLSLLDPHTLLYHFTVDDPHTWAKPWTGEYTWATTNEKMYEYACHENNYSLSGILRGARLQEADKAAAKPATQR